MIHKCDSDVELHSWIRGIQGICSVDCQLKVVACKLRISIRETQVRSSCDCNLVWLNQFIEFESTVVWSRHHIHRSIILPVTLPEFNNQSKITNPVFNWTDEVRKYVTCSCGTWICYDNLQWNFFCVNGFLLSRIHDNVCAQVQSSLCHWSSDKKLDKSLLRRSCWIINKSNSINEHCTICVIWSYFKVNVAVL